MCHLALVGRYLAGIKAEDAVGWSPASNSEGRRRGGGLQGRTPLGQDAVRVCWDGGRIFGSFPRTVSKESKDASLWLLLGLSEAWGLEGEVGRRWSWTAGRRARASLAGYASQHHSLITITLVACSPTRSNHTVLSSFLYPSVPWARIPTTICLPGPDDTTVLNRAQPTKIACLRHLPSRPTPKSPY